MGRQICHGQFDERHCRWIFSTNENDDSPVRNHYATSQARCNSVFKLGGGVMKPTS
jgi:hypothetical protein